MVRAAATPEQHVWRTTLGSAADDTAGQPLSPCVIVIGRVVQLGDDTQLVAAAAGAAATGEGPGSPSAGG